MPTIALYARVSDARDKDSPIPDKATNKRQTVDSANSQITRLREYCTKMDWTEETGYKILEYLELASASHGNTRPILNTLMQDCFSRKVDIVLVWAVDRFARSTADFTRLITELSRRKVRFIAATQGIDTDESNPASTLMMNMLAAFAQFERDLLSQRVKEGMKRARDKGTDVGRPKRIFDVERIIQAKAEGKTWEEISRETRVSIRSLQRRVREYENKNSD